MAEQVAPDGEQLPLAIPGSPRLGRALRDAATDFYFNSWRLVPANVVWGAALLALLVAASVWAPALALVPLLAVPVAGIYRLAALIQRGASVSFWDAVSAMRRFAGRSLAVGAVSSVAIFVFTANIVIGTESSALAGGVFAVLAAYADVGVVIYLIVLWPLLVDPARQDVSLAACLRLAALVALARPVRIVALAAVVAVILLVSSVLFAALLTVAIAYVALFTSRYVLPAADRVEGRATVPIAG